MAENDIVAFKELASGGFVERVLTPADISAAAATHASGHHTGGSDALTPANIGAAPAVTEIEVGNNGTSTTTLTTGQLPARVIIFVDANDAPSATINLPTPGVRQSGLFASIKVEIEVGSAASALITVVHDATTLLNGYELDEDESSIDFLWDGYAWTYTSTSRLRSYPNRVLQLPNASGTIALLETLPAGGPSNLWIAASQFIPLTSNGCGVDSRELATNDTNWDELLFDAGADEFAQAVVVMPSNYNNGNITARFYWTASGATDGSDNVVWGIQGRAFADDDALDQAMGTAQTVQDTVIATNDMHVSAATSAVTIAGTPAAQKPILFQIYRDADATGAGGDDYSHDARLLGVEIIYTAA